MQHDMRKAAEAFVDKVVAPRRERRSPDSKFAQARSDLARKNSELARTQLEAGGIDSKRLDALAAERSKERLQLAEQARHSAVEASAAAAARLAGIRPILPPPIVPYDTNLDTVTFIRSFAGQGVVIESNIGPGENWARYRLDSDSSEWTGTGRLSFFTLWQNQLIVPAVLVAQANLTVNANLTCNGDWSGVASWFGMSSVASAKVSLQTTVWGMDSSVSSIVQQQDLASIGVDGGFFGGDNSQSIEFSSLLPATGVVVPSGAYSLIEVEMLTTWSANGGASVTLDAESGSYRVDLPQLVLGITPAQPLPPPITLTASVSYATTPATITLNWTNATTSQVDIYENGSLLKTTANDGLATVSHKAGTYTYHVCNAGSGFCSPDVTVTVT